MGQQGGLAGERAQALSQHRRDLKYESNGDFKTLTQDSPHLTLSARKVLLAVEQGEDDVAQAGDCDAPALATALAAGEVQQVEPAAPAHHAPLPTRAVLVDLQAEHQVAARPAPRRQGRVKIPAGTLCCRG